ncbi:MAG: hypothetical protein AB7J30_20515 [Hyphomicrobium sp.]|uniref:DODA-type extradiol aromatic ring-opening family dioxygenase n=1 Tax=Hyphomicrobium sp. TaxID=82 RepID=UPI003D10ED74
MPLVLGLASSHAPSMFADVKDWPAIYGTLTRGEPHIPMFADILREFTPVPQPVEAAAETAEVLREYRARIDRAFADMRERLQASGAKTLLIFGDDQGEYLSPAVMTAFCCFVADEIPGTQSLYILGQTEEEHRIRLRSRPDLARHLLRALGAADFDVAWNDARHPVGRLTGLGHAFCHPLMKLAPELDISVVPFHVNAYFEPLPSARRCYELGRVVAAALAEWPEPVAIYGSGGLSHDPFGPRSGWIDKELDRWVLDQIRRGDTENLCDLFKFSSGTLGGGTAEIRSWIAVAGAYHGIPADVLDYIPAHHSVTGLGFASWPARG